MTPTNVWLRLASILGELLGLTALGRGVVLAGRSGFGDVARTPGAGGAYVGLGAVILVLVGLVVWRQRRRSVLPIFVVAPGVMCGLLWFVPNSLLPLLAFVPLAALSLGAFLVSAVTWGGGGNSPVGRR